MIIIAVANQKGGVGKTTFVRNLMFYAIENGLRSLAADLDPQRNFTKTMRAYRERTLKDAGEDEGALLAIDLFKDSETVVAPLDCGNGAGLIAATRDLLDVAEMPIDAILEPRRTLHALAGSYDVCFLDTPPTLGKPLYAALAAADYVVCPTTMDQDATDGLAEMFEDIARVQDMGWNPDLKPLGVLANAVNTRRTFDVNALAELKAGLGDMLLDTVLYERAATKYAKERAVWQSQRGESHQLAAKEMKAACAHVFELAGLV